MVNRWLGILSVIAMLLANGALAWRHILPRLLAGSPPANFATHLADNDERGIQVGIFTDDGRRIGSSWLVSNRFGASVNVDARTLIREVPVPTPARIEGIILETSIRYELRDNYLTDALPIPDEIEMDIRGLGMPVKIRGEDFSGDFPFEYYIGNTDTPAGKFLVPASALKALGNVFRPFDRMPGLYVGRMWQVKLFNPLSAILPNVTGPEMEMQTITVEVTGEEEVVDPRTGRTVTAFRVESPQARAWVHQDGTVLIQEVDLPIIGTLRLLNEPFDREAFDQAGVYRLIDVDYPRTR